MALAATILVVRKTWTPDVHIDRKAADDGQPDSYTFRFTSDALDRDGEIISADGWDFGAYEKNPVILDSHNNGGGLFGGGAGVEVIIGRAVPPLRQVDNAWEADIVFADTPRGQLAKQLVDGGFLRTVSVGFRSLEQRRKPNEPLVHLTKELMEISLVAIPSNRDAVRVRSAGDEITRDFNGMLQAMESRDELREHYHHMWRCLRECIEHCLGDEETAVADKIRECDLSLGQFHAAMNQWVADWLALPADGQQEYRQPPHFDILVKGQLQAVYDTLFPDDATPDAIEKAGRVLSTANLGRIRKALDSGQACCAELEALVASVEQAPEAAENADNAATRFADLALAERETAWDVTAARDRVAKWASSDGTGAKDKMDWPKYRKAFLWYDAENQEAFGGYKLPFADVVDGGLKAVPQAIFAAAQRLDGTDIPDADKAKVRSHLGKYYAKLEMTAPWDQESADPPEQKGATEDIPLTAAEEPPVLDLDLALLGQLIRR